MQNIFLNCEKCNVARVMYMYRTVFRAFFPVFVMGIINSWSGSGNSMKPRYSVDIRMRFVVLMTMSDIWCVKRCIVITIIIIR